MTMWDLELGRTEAERFREDLYLRIIGTTTLMSHALDEHASGIIADLQHAAASGVLHEDRAEVEWAKVADVAEHERFVYNWAHVMLTTRVIDALRALSGLLTEIVPKGDYRKKGRGELQRLEAEFAERFNITLSSAPTGTIFLEGMVLARNKIVHNGAMLWEAITKPNRILIEGDEPWTPEKPDQDFVQRFPTYVDGDRVTSTKDVFETNVAKALAFTEWLADQFDKFVSLLTLPTGSTPS
jgi:hypothetical protein